MVMNNVIVSVFEPHKCSNNMYAKEKRISIDDQWPGSIHDSRILKISLIYIVMNA